jgi:hypothetical protein
MQRVTRYLAVPLICACLMSAPALAAKADAAKTAAQASSPSNYGMRLKLDQAHLDPALADEECDDDDLMVKGAAQAYPSAPAAATATTTAATHAGAAKPAAAAPVKLALKDAPAVQRPAPTITAPAGTVVASAATPAPAETHKEAPKPKQVWEIVPTDKTLNAALARWAASAGWQLAWELPVDYAVEARTSVPGTFEEAVGMVAKSLEGAETPMKAIFYSGNKVLRIVAKGVE